MVTMAVAAEPLTATTPWLLDSSTESTRRGGSRGKEGGREEGINSSLHHHHPLLHPRNPSPEEQRKRRRKRRRNKLLSSSSPPTSSSTESITRGAIRIKSDYWHAIPQPNLLEQTPLRTLATDQSLEIIITANQSNE